MHLNHAVVRIDHHSAQILEFDSDQETDHQLVALARSYFPLHARMAEPMKPV